MYNTCHQQNHIIYTEIQVNTSNFYVKNNNNNVIK